MTITEKTVSIIIPVYNEERTVIAFLGELHEIWNEKNFNVEVLVIDDGSTDNTSMLLQDLALKNTEMVLQTLPRNYGKGFAVKHGVELAKGDLIIIIDGDGAFAAKNILVFIEKLNRFDIVLGNKTGYPWFRKIISFSFNLFVRIFFSVPTKDVLCGLKGFRSEVGKNLFSKVNKDDWLYDIELLIAVSNEMTVCNVPVEVRENPDSKFHILDPIKMIYNLLLLKKSIKYNRLNNSKV